MADAADYLFTRLAQTALAAAYQADEAKIRNELITTVREAIQRKSEQIGETPGWIGDFDTEMAEAAVDALADYYRAALGVK